MEVDDLPFAIPAVPDAGLFRLGRAGDAARIQVLRDADVGDAGRLVTHQVNVGIQDGGVHRLAVPGPHCRRGWEGAEGSHLAASCLASFASPILSNPLGRGASACLASRRVGLCDRAQLPGSQSRTCR